MRRPIPLLVLFIAWMVPARTHAGSAPLEAVCPVDWRGTSFQEALNTLASRLGVPYILDASVDAAALDRSVRMSASHLRGEEAFRWLARSAGLSAVLVDGTFLVAVEDRLPAVWRTAGTGGAGRPASRESDDGRWRRAQERRADIHWVDSPLSGVAADVSKAFGVDVVFHPAILAEQPLVCLEASQVGLDHVCEALSGQLGAATRRVDGAVWVLPVDANPSRAPTTRSAGVVGEARETAGGPLDRPVVIGPSVTTWAAFVAEAAGAAGVPYRAEVAPGTPYPMIEAAGPVAAVLEAARLLGWVSWRVDAGAAEGVPTLILQVHPGS